MSTIKKNEVVESVDPELEKIKNQLKVIGLFILCLIPASFLPFSWIFRFYSALMLLIVALYILVKSRKLG